MISIGNARTKVPIVLGSTGLCTLLAIFGIYPSNYESLFSPLNQFVEYFIWFCFILAIGCVISNKRIKGEKEVGNWSYLNLIVTLGLGCGFFSYCIDPTMYVTNVFKDPIEVVMHWYGPTQWILFIPFILIEIYETEYGLPKWLSYAKLYGYAISMMLAIGISLMTGCFTIPKIIYAIFQFEVSPYLLITPIAALIGISLIRGIHKGMRVFSLIAMISMYCVMSALLIESISTDFLGYSISTFSDLYGNFFNMITYDGTDFEIKYHYPFYIWMLTWAGIMSPFIHKISQGRKLRTLVTYLVIGPTVICQLYCVIAAFTFSNGGYSLSYFTQLPVVGLIYIIMMILMFVTSADSTCYNMDEMISKGLRMPVIARKLMWIIVMCLFITILMICGKGSMDALYGISYVTAPISMIICILSFCYILYKLIKTKLTKE